MTTNTLVSAQNVRMEKSMNLFENVVDEKAIEILDKDTLVALLKMLDKVK